jgi:hypothetical protein
MHSTQIMNGYMEGSVKKDLGIFSHLNIFTDGRK